MVKNIFEYLKRIESDLTNQFEKNGKQDATKKGVKLVDDLLKFLKCFDMFNSDEEVKIEHGEEKEAEDELAS